MFKNTQSSDNRWIKNIFVLFSKNMTVEEINSSS